MTNRRSATHLIAFLILAISSAHILGCVAPDPVILPSIGVPVTAEWDIPDWQLEELDQEAEITVGLWERALPEVDVRAALGHVQTIELSPDLFMRGDERLTGFWQEDGYIRIAISPPISQTWVLRHELTHQIMGRVLGVPTEFHHEEMRRWSRTFGTPP